MADSQTHSVTSNDYVENELHERLRQVAACVDADVLTYVGPIFDPLDDIIRENVERIDPRKPRLAVVLETDGGLIETAERIVTVFRRFYGEVWFLVPNHAMSAGTVLAMSGDRIYMDYYSTLGPIDPQVANDAGHFVPALGYLAKYEELIAKSALNQLTTAELAYLVERFDAADLYSYEQARDLSIDLLEKWLVEWKFKDWKRTEDRGRVVKPADRRRRARTIARQLNDTARWKSHGRGISKEVLDKELKLKINDFSEEAGLPEALSRYYRLLKDYMGRRAHDIIVHTNEHYFGV